MIKVTCIKEKLHNIKGATLIELLIVIAVMGIAMLPASRTLVTGFQTFVNENENMERVYDAHTALEIINDKIRFFGTEEIGGVDIQERIVSGISVKDLIIGTERIYYDMENGTIVSSNNSFETVLLSNVIRFDLNEGERINHNGKDIVSIFDIRIVVEKEEAGEEEFSTSVYLRNR